MGRKTQPTNQPNIKCISVNIIGGQVHRQPIVNKKLYSWYNLNNGNDNSTIKV